MPDEAVRGSGSPDAAIEDLDLSPEELLLEVADMLVAGRGVGLDSALKRSLALVGSFLKTDRVFIFFFSEDGRRWSSSHDVCRPGVPSVKAQLQDVSVDDFPWSMGLLCQDHVVEARSADALPEPAGPERAIMASLPIASFMTVPLVTGERVVGGMGADWVRQRGQWTEQGLKVVRIVGRIIGGVMERVRIEHDLRTAEERLRSFISHADDAVCCCDIVGGISDSSPRDEKWERLSNAPMSECNDAFARMLGAPETVALRGRPLSQLIPAAAAELQALLRHLIDNDFRVSDFELSWRDDSGRLQFFELQAIPVRAREVLRRVWLVLHDVSRHREAQRERRALEAQLRQSQRLEAIGLLAGGIAHDFNNLLMAILNYADLARGELRTNPDDAARDLDAVITAGQRARALTRQLLAFSRQQAIHKRAIDLNQLIENVISLLRRLTKESISIDFHPGRGLWIVLADAGQIEQALLNLVINANDAIAEVGHIRITTENANVDEAFASAHPGAVSGPCVLLTVSDDGPGMGAEVRDRAFEPFFTTKPAERGTGLGLSTVYGIVKQHEGAILLDSEPEQGATFRIYLPAEPEAAVAAAAPQSPVAARGGGETILVAEDNDLVRAVTIQLLERAGYRVIGAVDGAEAVDLFERHSDEIDLVILDAIMPRLSGRSAYDHIASRRPRIPVLFASGYSEGVFPRDFLVTHANRLLQKPYNSETLLRRVRDALDAR